MLALHAEVATAPEKVRFGRLATGVEDYLRAEIGGMQLSRRLREIRTCDKRMLHQGCVDDWCRLLGQDAFPARRGVGQRTSGNEVALFQIEVLPLSFPGFSPQDSRPGPSACAGCRIRGA